MNDINKWYADKCGVTEEINADEGDFCWYTDTHITYGGKWTISDPRCREIIREKFSVDTNYDRYSNLWEAMTYDNEDDPIFISTGATIAEAEKSCLQEIYEARDD